MKSVTRSRASRKRAAKTRSARARPGRIAPEFRAYMRKIDGYRAGRAPLPLLRTGPDKIARAVLGLSRRQLRRRPAPGKWSILEILGHLVDTEYVYGYRYRLALAQPGSLIQSYDQAQWVKEFRYQNWDARRLLHQIKQLRGGTLELLARTSGKRWKRYGWHTERGKETVRRTAELIAGHDLNHLDQIRAIRRRYGW